KIRRKVRRAFSRFLLLLLLLLALQPFMFPRYFSTHPCPTPSSIPDPRASSTPYIHLNYGLPPFGL
ncbi:hypothetical protein L9F63_026965, partial [Diploptera punctata]